MFLYFSSQMMSQSFIEIKIEEYEEKKRLENKHVNYSVYLWDSDVKN